MPSFFSCTATTSPGASGCTAANRSACESAGKSASGGGASRLAPKQMSSSE